MDVEVLHDMLDLYKDELKKHSDLNSIIDIAAGHGKYSIISKEIGFNTLAIDARKDRVPVNKFKQVGIEFYLSNLEDLGTIDQDICLLFGIFYHLDFGQQLNLLNKIKSKVTLIHTLIYNDNSKEAFTLENETVLGNLQFAVYKEGGRRSSRNMASMNNYFSIWHTEESLKNMFLNCGFKKFEKIKDITVRSGFYKAYK